MFEKHVHALIEHVSGDLHDLLMNVLVAQAEVHREVRVASGKGQRQRAAAASCRERSGNGRIALRRPKPKDDVALRHEDGQ